MPSRTKPSGAPRQQLLLLLTLMLAVFNTGTTLAAKLPPSAAELSHLETRDSTQPFDISPEQLEAYRALFQAAALQQSTKAATPNRRSAPSGNYGPSNVACPSSPPGNSTGTGQLRNASSQALNPEEAAYISRHRSARQADWSSWLQQATAGSSVQGSVPGEFSNYTSDVSRIPRIGVATSGGGYRAMLYGGGVFNALDSRNNSAVSAKTGGLLQLADYIAGLSGGSWLTGSVAINDYPTTQALHDSVWNLESNLVFPSDDALTEYASILAEVQDKRSFTGSFYTGITDLWSRALARHLINDTLNPDYGAATTLSDIRNRTNFQSAAYPFPIIIADEREPDTIFIRPDSAIWEFTPYEFGTWNPRIQAFVDIDYIGSDLLNGVARDVNASSTGTCVAGWDNAPWVMGVSSTLFNAAFSMLVEANGSSIIKDAVLSILGAIDSKYNDVALLPNPFEGYRNDTSDVAPLLNLTMVDGGEDGQNVPLWPLLQPSRGLDFIFALDSSADVNGWPNGTSLVATSDRVKNGTFSSIPFPEIPSQATFVNRGLNTRPTFFGCPGSQITNQGTAFNNSQTPIIAYIPNYPYVGMGNTSTYQLEYTNLESQGVMGNAFAVGTMGSNLTANSNISWPLCLSCGMLLRSFERSNTPIPAECQTCYDAYCWDGVTNDTVPALAYSPAVGTPEFVTSKGQVQRAPAYTGGNYSASSGLPAGGSGSSNAAAAGASHLLSTIALVVPMLGLALLA